MGRAFTHLGAALVFILPLLATLIVAANVPAHFIEKFSILSAKHTETSKLICEAFGTRPIRVTWLKQNPSGDMSLVPLDENSPFAIGFRAPPTRFLAFQKDFPGSDKKTVFELHIINSQLNDSALYVCKVANEFGEDAHNIELTVLEVPSAPENIAIDGAWSRGVSVVWTAPRNNGNSPISQYVIQYWKEGPVSSSSPSQGSSAPSQSAGGKAHHSHHHAPHRLYEEVISSAVTSHVLRDKLSPGTAYSLRILGQNQFGRGAPSSSVRFMTKEEAPDAAPIDISAESRGSAVVRLKWRAPPKSNWNGELKGYNIGHRSMGEGDDDGEPSNDLAQVQRLYTFNRVAFADLPNGDDYQQEYILTGLAKASTYSIIIQAYNSAGNGPFSQQLIASTSTNDPPAAPALWVTGVTEHSIKLKWDVKRNTAEVTHYVLYYKDDKSPWLEVAFPVPEESAYELINLEKGSWYQLYMRSMSKRGPSDPSEVLTIKTEGDSPHGISEGRSFESQQVPPYVHSLVVIPIAVAIVVIVIACASAYAYVKFEERKAALIKMGVAHIIAQSPSKNFQYISGSACSSSPHSRATSIVSEEGTLTLRYSDSSGRPLLARPPVPTVLWAQAQGPIFEESESESAFPSPYATMPTNRFTTFNPPPDQPPPCRPTEDPRRASMGPGSACSSFAPRESTNNSSPASSSLFCKADVHFEDSTSSLISCQHPYKPNN